MSTTTAPLRETDIRPDHLMDEQAARYAADVRRLLEHQGAFVAVPCPACAANDGQEVFRKYGMVYRVCPACETMYVSPRPTPVLLEMYYSSSENYAYWNRHIFPQSEPARRERIFRPRAQRVAEICRRHGVGGGTLLEVGAGFGTFCEEVRQLGLFERIVAVEPTPSLAETCRRRGLEVIEKPIEQAELPAGFQVIASFEVIEHLFAPSAFISRCVRLLAPGGLLILTCPSIKGFDIMTLGHLSTAVDTEHLNYFHPASVALLATKCGLEVLEVATPGKLDAELVRKRALAGEIDLSGQPFLRRVLVDEWEQLGEKFQTFLAENRLSSHLWLVARKPGAVA